ncbi:MAG: isoprenylcysteine carboxylmethyltransferase family protein [Leptolyngbyaceae cyanobacterium]
MKLFTDWGFKADSWQGRRGEYWVLAQGLLILGFALLPVYRPANWEIPKPPLIYGMWGVAAVLGLIGLVFFGKGLGDLGNSLTPLPHPREDGQLVQSGVYSLVRHPIYSGVIFVAIAWALYLFSLSHLVGACVLFLFFDAKARREEIWLAQTYPDYGDYRQRVKKFLPWLY